jgi:hypothetical protein
MTDTIGDFILMFYYNAGGVITAHGQKKNHNYYTRSQVTG